MFHLIDRCQEEIRLLSLVLRVQKEVPSRCVESELKGGKGGEVLASPPLIVECFLMFLYL